MNKKFFLAAITTLYFTFTNQNAIAQNNFVAGIETGNTSAPPSNSAAICDTIFSFHSVDSWPGGIVSDGNYIYCAGQSNPYIYKYSFTGVLADSIPHPAAPTALFTGDLDFEGNNLLVMCEENDTLYKVNPATGALISKFKVGPCTSNCWGVTYDGTYIWVADYSPSFIYKLDAATGTVLNTSQVLSPSSMLPIKFINGSLYGISLFPGMFHQIDTSNGNILSTQPWCPVYPIGFCVANNHLWGVSSSQSVGGAQRIYQFDSLILAVAEPILLDDQLQISPNPFTEELTVSGLPFPVELKMFDVFGKEILSQRITTLNFKLQTLNSLPAGMYFVKVNSEVKKIIKIK